jgi:excisionase family DNA binding protein
VELLLGAKPIVLEEDLSPAKAGEIAQISRPIIMHLLKVGKLKGYPVGSQMRIKKDSLLKYLEEREAFSETMAEMDKAGLGID